MAMIIREVIAKYNFVIHEISDERVKHLPLMGSPFPPLAILVFYVYFVKNLGPRLMKDRPAFKLDRLIQVYDAIQVVLALHIVERAVTLAWGGTYNWFCEPVDYSDSPLALETTWVCYTYFLIKMMDLLDTVFFVLRKKNSQVTFLHIYHHTCMAAASWGTVKYLAGGHVTFIGFINSIVHAIMYSYYLITSVYPEHKKNIWWKKHITQLQMVQFLMITLHSGQLLFQPTCGFPAWVALILVPQNSFMLAMFYDFYKKAYWPKTGKQLGNSTSAVGSTSTNGSAHLEKTNSISD